LNCVGYGQAENHSSTRKYDQIVYGEPKESPKHQTKSHSHTYHTLSYFLFDKNLVVRSCSIIVVISYPSSRRRREEVFTMKKTVLPGGQTREEE
jgi:hypothetical protein